MTLVTALKSDLPHFRCRLEGERSYASICMVVDLGPDPRENRNSGQFVEAYERVFGKIDTNTVYSVCAEYDE